MFVAWVVFDKILTPVGNNVHSAIAAGFIVTPASLRTLVICGNVERVIPFTETIPGEWHLYAVAQHLNPPELASLFVRFACLPDERHITRLRCGTTIVDTDRVCGGQLDVHLVEVVDEHDVESRCGTLSTGDGRGGIRFQADPFDAAAGNMKQTYLTYSCLSGAAAHDQHRFAGDRCNRCAVRARRKAV